MYPDFPPSPAACDATLIRDSDSPSGKRMLPEIRVLKVTQSYNPFLERGGPAVKVHALAAGLARRGHTVTVLTSDLGIKNAVKPGSITREPYGWRCEEDS